MTHDPAVTPDPALTNPASAHILNAKALQQTFQNLNQYKSVLENHLKMDVHKVKNELEQCVAHFEDEVSRLSKLVHPRVAAHITEGAPAEQAFGAAAAGVPTRSEQLAAQQAANEARIIVPATRDVDAAAKPLLEGIEKALPAG